MVAGQSLTDSYGAGEIQGQHWTAYLLQQFMWIGMLSNAVPLISQTPDDMIVIDRVEQPSPN